MCGNLPLVYASDPGYKLVIIQLQKLKFPDERQRMTVIKENICRIYHIRAVFSSKYIRKNGLSVKQEPV